jgi:hypothetical protein
MADHRGVSWGLLVVTVTVFSLWLLCVPVYAGVSPDVGRPIGDARNGTTAIIGETNLTFVDSTGVIIPSGTLKGDWDNSKPIRFPNVGSVFDSSKEAYLDGGTYTVTGDNGKTTTVNFYFPTFFPYSTAKARDVPTQVNGYDFDWVTRGGEITIKADTNLYEIRGPLSNILTYKLFDPRGARVYEVNGVPLSDISVDGDGDNSLTINTTGMRTGTYTLSIETDPETNNGLDVESPERSFEVRSRGVRIVRPDQEERTVTVTEDLALEFETTPATTIRLNVTWGIPSKVFFKREAKLVVGGQSDGDGKLTDLVVNFEVTGAFEITATEEIMGTSESVFIESVPYKAEITEPSEEIYYIGVPLKIGGTATAGDSVTIKIDDETFAVVERDGDSFEAPDKWQTEGRSPNTYTIAIWVSPFSDPATDAPDDKKTIALLRGGLFAKPSAPFVALGDQFTISGTVPGRDRVEIFSIAPDGGGGRGLDPEDIFEDSGDNLSAPGLTYETTGVNTDGEFETEKIAVGKDVDTGTYLIAALNYGRDGVWGKSQSSNLLEAVSNDYATPLGMKTTDQLLAILKDKTINAAGSDDLLGVATISVEQGSVTVDELEDVPLGGDIKVTGITNRQVDTAIIVTVESLEVAGTKLKPQIAKVKEDEKTYYNTFDVSFDTESANIGTYQVTVDDGDGHTASTTVRILPAEEHSVNVSTTPSPRPAVNEPVPTEPVATPSPTAATAPVPSSPTPEGAAKEPGFEALPALIALAVLGILLVRSRQKR